MGVAAGAGADGIGFRYGLRRTLVIKVTAGKDERPERCGQAPNVAATALGGAG